jgi:hypothetical protein
MKHIFTVFSLIGAFALLAMAVGCAGTQTQSKENLLIAAGFKTVVPKTTGGIRRQEGRLDVRDD